MAAGTAHMYLQESCTFVGVRCGAPEPYRQARARAPHRPPD
jgi:hypothetical protein